MKITTEEIIALIPEELNNIENIQSIEADIAAINNTVGSLFEQIEEGINPIIRSLNTTYASIEHSHSEYASDLHSHNLSDLFDTLFNSLKEGQAIKWDGERWVNFFPDYASENHNHNSEYSSVNHTHYA